jgi:NTP pyrophosphatase (non-canonical NTP hydrolase)
MKKSLKKLLEFREERDWKQFHSPKNLAISLVLEATEILELFQWSKDNNIPHEKKDQLEKEMADTYSYLLFLSYDFNIDLDKALLTKIKENAKKYPVNKAKGISKKYVSGNLS